MPQGSSKMKPNAFINKKRRREHEKAPKKKVGGGGKDHTGIRDNLEVEKQVKNKINNHQKKIYRSIEQTIIERAKKHREQFEII